MNFHYYGELIAVEGSRLLWESNSLKTPQEAVFASEEAEALPTESVLPEAEINGAETWFYWINYHHELRRSLWI